MFFFQELYLAYGTSKNSIPMSRLVYDQNSGQKFFFWKFQFSKKLQVLEKKWFPKFWVTTKLHPPPPPNFGSNFPIFPKFSKIAQELFIGVFEPEIFIFEP